MSDGPVTGTTVLVTDVEGTEHRMLALSEPKPGHKFTVVWVNRPNKDGGFDPMPWPVDSVRREDGSPLPMVPPLPESDGVPDDFDAIRRLMEKYRERGDS